MNRQQSDDNNSKEELDHKSNGEDRDDIKDKLLCNIVKAKKNQILSAKNKPKKILSKRKKQLTFSGM